MRTKTRGAKAKLTLSNLNQEKGNEEGEDNKVVQEKDASVEQAVNSKENSWISIIREVFTDGSLGISRHPERRVCIMCNRPGGPVLVCSGKGCPLAFHETCIDEDVLSFDESREFYCPFCWYRLKLEREEELRKWVLLAEKKLSEFLNYKVTVDGRRDEEGGEAREEMDLYRVETGVDVSDVRDQSVQVDKNKLSEGDRLGRIAELDSFSNMAHCRQDETMLASNLPKKTEIGGRNGNEKASKTHQLEILAEGVAHGDAIQDNGRDENIPAGEQHHEELPSACHAEEAVHKRSPPGPFKNTRNSENQEGGDKENETGQRAVNIQVQVVEKQHSLECDSGSDISETETETLSIRITRAKLKMLEKKKVEKVNSPRKSPQLAKVPKDRNTKDLNNKSIASKRLKTTEEGSSRERDKEKVMKKKPKLVQGSPNKCPSTAILDGRRKKLLWTPEEEDMLKEGVGKFSNATNKNIPWRKILDFGHHVFDSTRTPVDLKDKFRNMLSKDSP